MKNFSCVMRTFCVFQFDREQFEEKFVDMKWFESKKGFTFGNNPEEAKVFIFQVIV